MILRKFLAGFIIIVIGLTPILSSLSVSSAQPGLSSYTTPDSHIIEGVPYIAQTEGYFCYFTSCTMIFQYLGIDTSIDEVVYYAGTGYSTYYPYPEDARLPCDGQKLTNSKFLGSIFGLSNVEWYTNKTGKANDKGWFEYLTRLKQNISQDIPVLTCVDPITLPTLKLQLGMGGRLLLGKKPHRHIIVIVGYNDTNRTVCYHDSNAGYYGDPIYGTYFWLDIEEFREAVENADTPYYFLEVYTNPTKPKDEAFEEAHKINIERMKGNISAYYVGYNYSFNESVEYPLGIKALIAMKKDFEKGFNHHIKTIYRYKSQGKFGIEYRITNFLYHLFSILHSEKSTKATFLNTTKMSVFDKIAVEKLHTAKYLLNNKDISEICEYEAVLFQKEAKNWTKLSSYYSEFLKRGFFMSLPRAILIMDKMVDTLDDIIAIEEAIITGPE